MKFSDEEYFKALEELRDLAEFLQASKQMIYMSPLDKALSEVMNRIDDEVSK